MPTPISPARPTRRLLAACCSLALWVNGGVAEEPPASPAPSIVQSASRLPQSIAEARARAELLHETIHGTLQVVHRDLFDEEQTFSIPSRSLEDVFEELARSHQVDLRWLIVNADALNVDHKPQNRFEVDAVAALKKGKPSHEEAGETQYRFVGAIELKSQCLKCHLKDRRSNDSRLAGLAITIPWRATANRPADTKAQP